MTHNTLALRVHEDQTAHVEHVAAPEPADGEVVIRVRYSAINYKDALAVTGKGKILRRLPMIPGIDAAGEIELSADPRFQPGDAVIVTGSGLGERIDGAYAELVKIDGELVVPLPAGLSLHDAMALGTAGFTAAYALHRMLENHQTPAMGPIVVTGATGGVGAIAVDLLSSQGFEVVAVTGKADRSDWLRELGASEILLRQDIDPGERPLESARWGGAIDNVGDDLLAWLTRTLKPRGNIAAIGLAGGVELHTTVLPFILRGINLLGINSVDCARSLRHTLWSRLAGDWRPPHLHRIVAGQLALTDIPAYCEEMMAGRIHGRMLVKL